MSLRPEGHVGDVKPRLSAKVGQPASRSRYAQHGSYDDGIDNSNDGFDIHGISKCL